ncbi:MAG: hypothetical protein NZ959_00535 [Armatimonadetes bacterium]|nr:hypothetical protein [Armatimonadota bacterium]MDW8120800.1 hypothetical protein [Armatimonadota bacterium]
MTRPISLPWPLRRLRRWIVAPQREWLRLSKKWRSSPVVAFPRFLNEVKALKRQLIALRPDVVVANLRSGGPYGKALEPALEREGIRVLYQRICSAWGHQTKKAVIAVTRLDWLLDLFAYGNKIVLLDVSRRHLSDAQRVAAAVAVFIYNEALSRHRTPTFPFDPTPTLNKALITYLRSLPETQEVIKNVERFLENWGPPPQDLPFALYRMVAETERSPWVKGFSCLVPINASREGWMDDRTERYGWFPNIARLLI